jgi:type IV secretion system protein VirB3
MNFFIINATVSMIVWLVLDSLWVVPVPLILHAVGYFACLREPRIFDLWITKVSKCPRVPNFRRWGCNSYAP